MTGELDRRPSRAPDYEAESRALASLAETMISSPQTVLQHLVDATMRLIGCDSVGISLFEPDGDQGIFRWIAVAGAWSPYSNGTMPRAESPCGEVVTRETVLLMDRPARAFPVLLQAQPGICEALLAPFDVNGVPAGTIWAIVHAQDRRFDAEDARLLGSLARFAALTHQVVLKLGNADARRLESDTRLRALARASSDVFYIMSSDMSELRELSGGDFIADTKSPSRVWLHDYIPPEDHARTTAAISEAIRTKSIFELEHRVRQVDGGVGWALSRAVPVLGTDGEIVEWFGAASDISARKLAEAALVEREERQAFLLEFSDALRAERSPEGIANRALRMLFDHMRLDRCYVGIYRMDEDVGDFPHQVHADRLPPLPGKVRLSDFPDALRVAVDRTLVVDDVGKLESLSATDRASFARLGLRALIAATLRRGEKRPLWAIVAVSTSARDWTQGDVSLVEEVTERTWAAIERVRAEISSRDSEARLAAAFEGVPVGAAVINPSGTAVLANAEYRRFLPTGIIPSRDPEREGRWRGWDDFGAVLAPEDHPGARALRGERVVPGQEMLYTDDDGREIWTRVASVPTRDADGALTGQLSIISDIDALKRSSEALQESEGRFRQFSDASTNILWIRNAATLRMEFASPAFDAIYGTPGPERGGDPGLRAWARLIDPESRREVLGNFRRVRAGERVEVEFRIKRASDGASRWIHNTDFPLRDASGNVAWLAGLGADITESREAADRQGVLVAELQHRTRNLIAVVRSLSDRTLGNSSSLQDFGQRFRLRLAALSRVQGLLSHLTIGERVAFDELLRSELSAHGANEGMGAKVTLEGPAGVPLRSGTVQTLALALHELATNAVKYGALASAEGHLTVRWHVEATGGSSPPLLHVEWRERGVVMPPPNVPSRGGGYGRELIERALPYQLKARTSYEFGADGVRCTIAVPISGALDGGVSSDG